MFIYFGHLSKSMLIPLSIPIIYSIRHYLLDEFDIILKNKHQSVFLHTFLTSISYSLNIFLFIIEYRTINSKNGTKQEKEFKNQLLIEKEKMEKKQNIYKKLYLVLLPLFLFFNLISYDILTILKPNNYNKNYYYNLSVPVFFILTALMSYQFLHIHIHRHQIMAMIISLLFSLSLFFILIIYGENGNKSFYAILFLIESVGIRSLRFVLAVLGKLFMLKMYSTHIELMTFFGLFGILFSLITNAIFLFINMNFIKNPELNDYFYIDNDSGFKRFQTIFDSWGNIRESILYLIGTIICFFFEKYMSWFCINKFSPNHYTMYSSINSLWAIFWEICSNLFKNKKYTFGNILNFVFSLSVFIIIVVCSLIFNEILIIKLFNLDKYTNVEINKRQKIETKITLNNHSNNNTTLNRNSNSNNPNNSFESEE